MKDFKTTLDEVRKTWMEENPCEDGHDHVTPFDKFYYGNYTLIEPAGVGGEWPANYCPECGSDEVHHSEGDHIQCGNCLQEYFTSIDYSSVVRENLRRLHANAAALAQQPAAVDDGMVERALSTFFDQYSVSSFIALKTPANTRRLMRAALTAALAQPAAFDFAAHLQRQREWSERTFGPGPRTAGVIDHIRKELREIEAAPHDGEEWIDAVILALDGAWRSGLKPQQIIETMVGKQAKNERRAWPDWRTSDPDKAIEHDRTEDQQPAAVDGALWKFVADAFDNMTMSESERFLELLRLPDDHAWLQLHWHIQRALAAQPGGSANDR